MLFVQCEMLMIFCKQAVQLMATEIVNSEVPVGENESETLNGIEKLDISNGIDEVSENSSTMQKDEDEGTGGEFVVG